MEINQDDKKLINGFIPTTIKNLNDTSEHYGHVKPETNPAFYGSYDWHSSIHSHWQVIRALRCHSDAPYEDNAVKVLNDNLTAEKIEQETENVPEKEVPYGMAWILLLAQELCEWDKDSNNSRYPKVVKRWLSAIEPLETYAGEAIKNYIEREVAQNPNRKGYHYQTALSLTLALDWARSKGNDSLIVQIEQYTTKHYTKDVKKPEEPDLTMDFLSPSLAEADLLRRVLKQDEFTDWLNESYFLGNIKDAKTYAFIEPPDFLYSHIYGLNISRACMAKGIASALKEESHRTKLLRIAHENYKGGLKPALIKGLGVSHWVPTYIMYYVTNRGIYGV